MTRPTIDDVYAARERIRADGGVADRTPLERLGWLDGDVRLKFESHQTTRSFKIRGATNAVRRLDDDRPLVTASAGNHGLALATAARRAGRQATIFVATTAARAKVAAIAATGADLRRSGLTYDDAERAALEFARERGARYVSPYNHTDVIAGAGTVGLEIVEEIPDVAAIVVPIGGGGLISGVAIAARALAPAVRIVGVEADRNPAFTAAIAAGAITPIDVGETLADGLSGNLEPGAITFEIVRDLVDEIVTVTDAEMVTAIRALAGEEGEPAEGAGIVALAAIMSGKVNSTVKGPTVAIVSGANIDADTLLAITGA